MALRKLPGHLAAWFALVGLVLSGFAPIAASNASAAVYTAPPLEALTIADVQKVIAQAVGEARARGAKATIAVVDRVGNVLAVYRMTGAATQMRITARTQLPTSVFPSELGAIAKAITAAYLSSSGNAFSTRTASMIVQPHFPPAPSTPGLESGPLFGVQFSQLPCSDLNTRFPGNAAVATAMIGPKRSPLGLAADPGGLPLYKRGVVVGGIGVMADGIYGFDPNVLDFDKDLDEVLALAGLQGFAPPITIRADRIPVDGTTLRFSDAMASQLHPLQSSFAALGTGAGALIAVAGFYAGTAILPGVAYGTERSGIRLATAAEFSNREAFILSDGNGVNRFPIRGGTDAAEVGTALSPAEVRAVLEEAFKVMSRARAQIRRPLDSPAQVSISVVDTWGTPLGLVRSPDAPIFGTDVSLQKARTAAFFSNPRAGALLFADPDPGVAPTVAATRSFLADTAALTGKSAFSNRAVGLLARPYFPDGEVGRPNGPLSLPIASFSPFATGLQTALIARTLGADRCTNVPRAPSGQQRLANGIQIFPGAVPIYRGSTLVGAIGVSGDGIDQDDMIAFLGASNGGKKVGSIGNAPKAMRSDRIVVKVGVGVRLRYVNCPFAPFLDTSAQNVCEGL
ncbi:heme-binding protein [Novosphingobium sp.]|uniref:heme-binding protein n=1 Tax=Novosphingobium sp. TaxID=1874826 RepID=UPI001DB2C59E|nr:heme-binding protein [Novosphingobium sp.]MBX9663068.1 heme-binding protein [Novosphingobium sp.]